MPLTDPVYDQLDQLDLTGALPPYRGGLLPLTQARVHELLPATPAPPSGWWLRPLERAAFHLMLAHEAARTYSTAARPRNVAGILALSCEAQDRDCHPFRDGVRVDTELDATAGHGSWLAGAIRLRAHTGSGDGTGLDVDRASISFEVGPVAAELGRDIVVLGPASRTQPGWGTSAPPLDHIRMSSARPLAVSTSVRANVVYVLGRLAAPQTYPGNLVSVARAQLDLGDCVELGAMQLLQLGGEGAPSLGLRDFVLEHVRRRDPSASASDSSNRRLGVDAAAHIPSLGARISYQLVFEDLRQQVVGAVRHDADHVIDIETRAFTVEWQKTGARSYEHVPRVTGFTTGGRIVGAPLGPDAHAVRVDARIRLPWSVVMPWAQLARLASDTYNFGDGPIVRTGSGQTELRLRIGTRVRMPVGDRLDLDAEVALEDVERASFVPGVRHLNAVLRVLLVWRPSATLVPGVMR